VSRRRIRSAILRCARPGSNRGIRVRRHGRRRRRNNSSALGWKFIGGRFAGASPGDFEGVRGSKHGRSRARTVGLLVRAVQEDIDAARARSPGSGAPASTSSSRRSALHRRETRPRATGGRDSARGRRVAAARATRSVLVRDATVDPAFVARVLPRRDRAGGRSSTCMTRSALAPAELRLFVADIRTLRRS